MIVRDAVGLDAAGGDIGIEIEMEANNLPRQDDVRGEWKLVADNSLRGESGEFVLRRPVSLSGAKSALNKLSELLNLSRTEFRPTYRAGVHVHVNVQELTTRQLVTYAALYFMLEESLLSWCDPSRVGNHFCLRAVDAEHVVDVFTNAIKGKNLQLLGDENIRYASINFNALCKYGSLEFRALESTSDFDRIYTWAAMLHQIREFAKTVEAPTDIIGQASMNGFYDFAKSVMGKYAKELEPHITEERVRRGVRNIQGALYSHNWSSKNLNIFDHSKGLFS